MSNIRPAKHAPARFSHYFRAHHAHMEQLRGTGFVGEDTLVVEQYLNDWLMYGEIGCKGQIVLSVTKRIERVTSDRDPLVQTTTYSYYAFFRGGHGILRYDNQHQHPGHVDHHHKHPFDWKSGDEDSDSPQWNGAEEWPTLSDVLWELMQRHSAYYSELAAPEEMAVPTSQGLRLSMGFE